MTNSRTVVADSRVSKTTEAHPLVKIATEMKAGALKTNSKLRVDVNILRTLAEEGIERNRSAAITKMVEVLTDEKTEKAEEMKHILWRLNAYGEIPSCGPRLIVGMQELLSAGLVEPFKKSSREMGGGCEITASFVITELGRIVADELGLGIRR